MATKKNDANLLYALAGAAAVAVLGAAYAFGVSPQLSERSIALEQVAVEESTNATLNVTLADLTQKSAALDAKRQEVRLFADRFPGDADQDATVASIQEAAGAAGVEVSGLESITPTVGTGSTALADPTAAAETSIAVVPLSLRVSGTQEGIQSFLGNIEGLERTLVIDAVAISNDGTDATRVTANITARAFLAQTLVDPAEEVIAPS